MPATTSVSPSGNQDIDGLLYTRKWAVSNFTFSFPTSASFYESGSAPYGETTTNFGALNATQQNYVRNFALSQFAAVANVTFTEITESATTHADLRFAKTDATDTAWGYFPASQGYGGDTWYRNSGGYYDNPVIGNYAAHTFLHEIGHAFGLEHGHDSSNPYGALPAAHDSLEYTIMTYRSYVGAPTNGYTYGSASAPQTLMQNDIAALQYLYGANYNTNSGNTVYSWNPTTGQTFINGVSMGAVAGNKIFMTLWDGNGIDTYDLSAYSTNLTINLQPGAWNTFSSTQLASLGSGVSAAGNVANALLYNNNQQSLIENAIGGSGNDTIVGNAASNRLVGNSGNDVLSGLDGNDTLVMGPGLDTATGGAGNDTFVFQNPNDGADTITDFVSGTDILHLEAAGFSIVTTGSLSAAGVAFVLGTAATAAGRAIVYDQTLGKLYWDADGVGGQAQVLLATLDGGSHTESSVGGNLEWQVIAKGDFNADGTDDLLWRSNANGATVLQTIANGQYVTNQVFGGNLEWKVQATGDFNGDGTDDILWRSNANGGAILQTLNNASSLSTYWLGGNLEWSVIGTGDFNRDGTDDLLWRSNANGATVLQTMSNGQYATNRVIGGNLEWKVAGIGDFNGDGTDDMIWQSTAARVLVIWTMFNGQILTSATFKSGDDGRIAATGDFDHDGTDEIIWEQSSGTEMLWDVAAGQYVGSTTLSATGLKVGMAGDFNNDQTSDIVWQNTSSGTHFLWSMSAHAALNQTDFLIV